MLLASASLSFSAGPSVSLAPMRAPAVSMREAAWKPGEVAPAYLDGSLPADSGCDPLCLAALAVPVRVKPSQQGPSYRPVLTSGSYFDRIVPFTWSVKARKLDMASRTPEEVKLTLDWMREAELKHARLAMLAVVGWPLAELLNPLGALSFTGGCAGSAASAYLPFLLLVAGVSGYVELQSIDDVNQSYLQPPEQRKAYVPGNLDFDPLGLRDALTFTDQAANEIYNGRLAMCARPPPPPRRERRRAAPAPPIAYRARAAHRHPAPGGRRLAITGFAAQEFVWGAPVVDLPISGFFFGR